MKYAFSLAAMAAGLAAASDVIAVTQDNFESFVGSNPMALLSFTAPWCGHCKSLAPEFEEASTILKDKGIPLGKVDCTEQQELCSAHGIEGYPTLKIFRGKDQVSAYSGQRKAAAIVSYMTKQALPAVSDLLDETAYEEFKTADKVVLVGYFAADDKTSNTTFTAVADSLRDSFMFGATSDAALAKAAGVKQPSIVLYKSFDEGKTVFDGKLTIDAITEFAKVASTPLIGEVGPETYSGYMASGIPLAYIFADTQEERDQFASELKEVAQKHKGKINFATIDSSQFGQHATNLNLEAGQNPSFAIQDVANGKKYPYSKQGDVKSSEIIKFVEDFVAGKVEPSIKSEPIPEKQEGPVTIVVAKNYDDIVLDDTKDVLLEIYAPWCSHCKALAPKWDALAELYASSSAITIAKVDATANDIPDEVEGFPTIKLYKAGAKDAPVTYNGARTVEDLAAFVRENGSHKVEAVNKEDIETAGMPSQAPAATIASKAATGAAKGAAAGAAAGAASKVAEVVKDGAAVVIDAILEDETIEDHDEL